VTKEAYASLVAKSIELLKQKGPYDGIFFDIHGAMSVQGMDDPEADFIKQIRAVVGTKVLISTSMDLHGNVSLDLAKNTDLITCYRMAPHEDAIESKRRAVSNLVTRILNGKGKPAYKAWVGVPILLPGEKTSTRIEPGKTLYAQLPAATSQEGIIDAAIWIGYAWADAPRNHAAVVVTGDDQQKVTATAEAIAKSFWAVRNEFVFVAPTASLEESLQLAIASKVHPYLISDMGDNPTAGGAGDVTWTLKKILERKEFKTDAGPSVIYASIPGPALVGAAIDNRYAPPVLLTGIVESIYKGDINAEVEVAVKVGSVHLIVTQKRKPYHLESDYTRLGLSPRKSDIVIVKIGYLVPELYDLRADWIMATTPGGVDQDLKRLPYKKIERPMFPLDDFKTEPSLKAVMY
jgi:microcystin degradation protein MlrC